MKTQKFHRFRIILLVLSFSMGISAHSAEIQRKEEVFSKGPVPEWVQLYTIPLQPIPIKPSQVNLQYLLFDNQRNWEEKTLYSHYVVKALTRAGIEKVSQLSVCFDPSHFQLVMHKIRIFREGKWVDRLESARHHLIQRESALEERLYSGNLTLVYFLDDIREGDLIEYAYSIKGYYPFFASHYVDRVYFQSESSIEQIVFRLLANPNLCFLTKSFYTDIKPKVKDLSPSLREWVWEATATLPRPYEPNEPIWYNPLARIEMSQYGTWEEVSQKLSPLVTLSADSNQWSSVEMRSLVKKWIESARDLTESALFALRFVQDEVRYFGFENGMCAFQPTEPRIVFERRFGDCKDKTFLLYALLNLMQIPSTPILVQSTKGKVLPDLLPSPLAFDHIVLRVELNGSVYWVDPTLRLQGGSLQSNSFPNYEWGLPLSNDATGLVPLSKPVLENPIELEASFRLTSEDTAQLKMRATYQGPNADELRRACERLGLQKWSEESLSELREIYGKVTLNSPLEIVDDRENNILQIHESYCISTKKLSNKRVLEIFSYTIKDYLHHRINPERTAPYALTYPLWVREHIRVENPFNQWKAAEKKITYEHPALLYTYSMQQMEKSVDFYLELQHMQDHVPINTLEDYWDIVSNIKQDLSSKLIIKDPSVR